MTPARLQAVPVSQSRPEWPLSALADEITQLSAHLDAGAYRLLRLIGEFDQREGWNGTGIKSCAHWLNWKCGMSLGTAREQVRVARALPELPKISAAMKEGQVSYSKVRAMTRVATPENEHALLEVALHGTAHHVERQVRAYRKVKRIEALREENARHDLRELSWHEDDDGSWVFRGRFTAEQGALVVKALEAAMDRLFEEQRQVLDVPAGTSPSFGESLSEPIAQRRADALVRVAEGFLAHPDRGSTAGERYLVNIHTDMETLKHDGEGAEAEIEGHGNVPAETSRRLACDCSVVHWNEGETGEPLNIGRKSRSIPPAIRRALQRRDGGCRFPGCTCNRFVDAHHIRHWADGGETSLDNLVQLCRTHHRLVHEGRFGVQRLADGAIRFTSPCGMAIPEGQEKRFRGNVLALRARNREAGLDITPETPVPEWHGERMDTQMAVEMLLQFE